MDNLWRLNRKEYCMAKGGAIDECMTDVAWHPQNLFSTHVTCHMNRGEVLEVLEVMHVQAVHSHMQINYYLIAKFWPIQLLAILEQLAPMWNPL